MESNRISEPAEVKKHLTSLQQMLPKVAVIYTLMAAALFIPAGRLNWLAGWALLGAHITFTLSTVLWLSRHNPDLLAERAHALNRSVRRIEKILITAVHISLLSLYAVAGLDAGRFGWSIVPAGAQILGWLLVLTGGLIVFWVLRTNTFASVVVRVQSERGHQVIQHGPYRIVRHPMYVGVLTLIFGLPLLLGSWWAFIPVAALVLIFFYRTAKEDRYLHDNLQGYTSYSTHTRYRLIPGLW